MSDGLTLPWLLFTMIPGAVGLVSLIAVPVLLYSRVEEHLRRSVIVGFLLVFLSSLPMVWTMRVVERDVRGVVYFVKYLPLMVEPFALIGAALLVTAGLVWVERGKW